MTDFFELNTGAAVIDVYDNVLEDHLAEYVQSMMMGLSWKYEYSSKLGEVNKHWHIFWGHDPENVVDNGYDCVLPIWDTAKIIYDFKSKYSLDTFVRIYMNAHTHGIEPHIHRDDGDFTMIYYPRCDWQKDWGGGTVGDGMLVEYVGNRLVVFDAYLEHQAQPVSRQCYELRNNIVFKCHVSGANRERLDFYKNEN